MTGDNEIKTTDAIFTVKDPGIYAWRNKIICNHEWTFGFLNTGDRFGNQYEFVGPLEFKIA